ncbi:MAG: hypothetical protein WCH39_03395 [Schlesneria sp.]
MRLAIPLLILVVISGCRTHLALQDHTQQTAATLADLNYHQVLENVARFVCNSSTLPSVAVVNSGNVLVSDQGSFGGVGTYTPTIGSFQQIGGFPIFNMIVNPNVTHNLTENWTMTPVTDIEKVRRIRCAFQILVGGPQCSTCDDCLKTLEGFIPSEPEQLDCAIPTGWFFFGCKSDVPADACYVAHYQKTYVWVLPDGVDGLSRFTMTVLQLSTSELDPVPTKTVVTKYDAKGEIEGTEITTEEPDEDSSDPVGISESGSHLDTAHQKRKRKVLKSGGITPKQTAATPKQARKRPGVPAPPPPSP